MSDTKGSDAVGQTLADAQAVGEAARQVSGQARQVGSQAIDQAQQVAREAQERGASLASAVGERAASAAQTQKEGLAGQIEDVAQAVHRSGEQLEGHQDWVAGLVERGADELSALANTVRTNDLRALMGNIQDLARRQPALFVSASLVAGFALARVGRVAMSGMSQTDLLSFPGHASGGSASPPPTSVPGGNARSGVMPGGSVLSSSAPGGSVPGTSVPGVNRERT
jgi:hypothetical protein